MRTIKYPVKASRKRHFAAIKALHGGARHEAAWGGARKLGGDNNDGNEERNGVKIGSTPARVICSYHVAHHVAMATTIETHLRRHRHEHALRVHGVACVIDLVT